MNEEHEQDRILLARIGRRAMLERGLLPEFDGRVLDEVREMDPGTGVPEGHRDLRDLVWSSIDNDDSRDLDQLTVAEQLPAGRVRILVAIADVDWLVRKDSPTDHHARHNTTSVYTAGTIYPMLPEKLSTDLTSLNPGVDRRAMVVDMVVGTDGAVEESAIYQAVVRNHAKLAYNNVAAWLDGDEELPEAARAVKGLDENLRLQAELASVMDNYRHERGALGLETTQSKPVFNGNDLVSLDLEVKNRAHNIIEEFMIAANGVTARFLAQSGMPSIRRVVRTPERWERIVHLAAEHGFKLPKRPDSRALELFLMRERGLDPLRFPDLSLSVIKLMGSGEYVAVFPGDESPGHFGLAAKDYSHSTAPNRRFSDLITQRLLKAALNNGHPPYSDAELQWLATHCTDQEDAAEKVERQVSKSAAALLLEPRINEQFDAIITGASRKGVFARLLSIPVEGKVVSGFRGVDVGDQIRVRLRGVNVERGFIDLARVGRAKH